jgi:hypothetical protein
MAMIHLNEIEYGVSKLRTVDIALMTICEGRNDRDLDDVHHTLQVALEQIKGAIQDEEG